MLFVVTYRKNSYEKYLGIFILFFFILSLFLGCQSGYPENFLEIEENNLQELPTIVKRRVNGKNIFTLAEYTFRTIKTIDTLEQGAVDLSGKLKYTQRKVFEIINSNLYAENAESLFVFNKEGFDNEAINTGTYYGKTDESGYPYTISLVANPTTRIFYGKAKKKDVVLDIQGIVFFENNLQAEKTEIAFTIKMDGILVGYLQRRGIGSPSAYIVPDIDENIRTTILYSIGFLMQFKRFAAFNIDQELVKGED